MPQNQLSRAPNDTLRVGGLAAGWFSAGEKDSVDLLPRQAPLSFASADVMKFVQKRCPASTRKKTDAEHSLRSFVCFVKMIHPLKLRLYLVAVVTLLSPFNKNTVVSLRRRTFCHLTPTCGTYHQTTVPLHHSTTMKVSLGIILASFFAGASAFAPASPNARTETSLQGLFDGRAWGTGADKDSLDEQWQRQQEILANRRDPNKKKAYFDKVEADRREATRKQKEMWSWQTKKYGKGEDPIDEWRKRRADGTISDLENQYGDPKKIGGIPLPSASFGVGGEFGVG